MAEKRTARKIRAFSLDEFKAESQPRVWEALERVSGGTFMQCHLRVLEETGIWIEELTPVFAKLDANLQQ